MKQIYFYNKTDVPIMIDFMIEMICLENNDCLHSIKIEPGEKRKIYSSNGEWILHSNFSYYSDSQLWIEKGYEISNYIGKINIKKKIFNLDYKPFCFHYMETIEDNKIISNITFTFLKIKQD
jgi:hypothetical protein